MRKIDVMIMTVFVLIVIVLAFAFRAWGERIQLEWDPVDDVDGYRIYQTIRGGDPVSHTFDFTKPVTTDTYPDGNIPRTETQITIDLPGVEGEDTKYMFVARSFRGDETSENSNEVSYVVSLVPPFPPAELRGSYDKPAGLVHLEWSQPTDEYEWRTIDRWSVYYRISGTQEWAIVGTVEAGGDLQIESAFSAVAEGETADVEFVVVSHRRSGVFSENSDILTLTVDRRGVPPIQNLRISIEIPVI